MSGSENQRLRSDHLVGAASQAQKMQQARERTNVKFHDVIGDLTGVSGVMVIKASHVLRALTSRLLHAEGQLDRRVGERGPIIRPANGDLAALEWFEREIGLLLSDAIRDAGPLRPG